MGRALPAVRRRFTAANVVRWRRRESAVRGFSSVRDPVVGGLDVGSMTVSVGAIPALVGTVL